MIGPVAGLGKFDDIKNFINFILNKPDLYKENKQDCYGNTFTKVGLIDNGYGNTNIQKEVISLDKEFISTEYLGKVANPVVIPNSDVDSVGSSLSTIAIYDVTQTKSATKKALLDKYSALKPIDLKATDVPDNIKKLAKGYDFIIIFPKMTTISPTSAQ
jgi:hypothetical protein